MMRTAVRMAPPIAGGASVDRLPDASGQLALGVLAAQVAMAAHRVVSGTGLDDADTRALSRARHILSEAVEAAHFASSGGRTGAAPSNFHAFNSTMRTVMSEVPDGDAVTALQTLADHVARLQDELSEDSARLVERVFASLSENATSSASIPGERHILA
jgi:hypothetical protein